MPRKLTLLPLIAATYFIVAGGPFGLEDIVARAGYAGAILILLVTPVVWAIPSALMVSELASTIPEEGGYYVWATRSMGPFWGFQEAWLSLVGSVFDMAIYPTLFVSYLGHFAPAVTAGWRGFAIGVALIGVAAAWNLLGASAVGDSSVVMAILLLTPFAVLSAYAAMHRGAAPSHAALPVHFDLLGGILVAMWNYMGFDNTSTIAAEVDRPRRTYPLAMAGTVAIIALSYVIPIGAVALTGLPLARWSTGGWADVARGVFGSSPAGPAIAFSITAVGMMAAAGTLLGLTLALSRLPAVLAQDGYLPRVLARRNPYTGVPWVAVLVCAGAWAACLGLSFSKLVMLDVLLTGLSILLEFASLVALRIREPLLPRPYKVPGGLAGAIGIGVPPLALLILTGVRNQAEAIGPFNALQLGGILIGLGVVAYFLRARKQQT
ncbi:MAG: APC family permease [Bryobacteraceae bacterium]|jgi:amino acid transporter